MEHTDDHETRSGAQDGRRAPSTKGGKFAAVLEVLGIYVGGQLVAFVLATILGIPLANPLTDITPDVSLAELLNLTGRLLVILALQYAGWFALAFATGWWHRRRKPAQYGLTLAGHSGGALVVGGIVLFAFADLPLRILAAVNSIVPLGESIPWREVVLRMDWSRPEYWLLMAVGSFGLVPILEELFYRGYCQTRLEEDLGGPAAVLATAALFALSHSQYYIVNILNIATLVTLIFSAIAWGYVYYRTRSLLVTIIAHVLVNFPVPGAALVWGLPLAMLIICLAARRQLGAYLRQFAAEVRGFHPRKQMILVTVLIGLFAVVFALLNEVAILAGLLFFVAAIVLEVLDRRQARSAASL